MENNRNFFITIALSVLILTLWQVFYILIGQIWLVLY